MKKMFLIIALGLNVLTVSAWATTRYVPSQYSTIQSAINACNNGDTVIVADGTYTGTGNRDIDISFKTINVQSENGPENCIIDCQGSGRGFYLGEDANAILDGFTVTNGSNGGIYGYDSADWVTITNCRIIGNIGKGIDLNYRLNGNITNSTISGNSSDGIYMDGVRGDISGCEIVGNSGNGIWAGYGINIISDCNIIGNSGRGLLLVWGATINNCYIADNSGGGVYYYYPDRAATPTISNCVISGNSAVDGAGIYIQYGMYLNLMNCTISGNFASNRGGGICFSDLDIRDEAAIITGCLFWDNTALGDGDEIAILYDHGPSSIPVRVSYTDILRGPENIYEEPGGAFLEWGEGNIDVDPMFVTGPLGEYYLDLLSPCVDAGSSLASNFYVGGTTRTDGVDDTGFVDMGYHYNAELVTEAVSHSMYKSGSAVSAYRDGYDNHKLENSDYVGGCYFGTLMYQSRPSYFFILPPSNLIQSVEVSVYGKGDVDWFHIGSVDCTLDSDEGWHTFTFTPAEVLYDFADDSASQLGVYLNIGNLGYYDIKEIKVTYVPVNPIVSQYLVDWHTAYSAADAISIYKTEIVDALWDDIEIAEEYFYLGCQESLSFAQNLSGIDGSLYSSVKAIADSLKNVQNLGDTLASSWDHVEFWFEYPSRGGPSKTQISNALGSATTELTNLADLWRISLSDGVISDSEAVQLKPQITAAKNQVENLRSVITTSATKMALFCYSTRFLNGGQPGDGVGDVTAEIMLESFLPMIDFEYDELGSCQNQDPSYLYELKNVLTEQEDMFVTVDFDITPSSQGLHYTVDGSNYTASESFVWVKGRSHLINAPATKTGTDGYIYGFDSWSDGGAQSRSINPMSDSTYTVIYTVDNQPPMPNPMYWDDEPNAISATSITMTATEASDPEGNGVEYYFECTSGGGHNSNWQNERTYTDNGLQPNTTYTYTVKARDQSFNALLNVTGTSSPVLAITYRIADFDASGLVDFEDLRILANQWLQPPSTPSADIAPWPSIDGTVNFLDFSALAKNWYKPSP